MLREREEQRNRSRSRTKFLIFQVQLVLERINLLDVFERIEMSLVDGTGPKIAMKMTAKTK